MRMNDPALPGSIEHIMRSDEEAACELTLTVLITLTNRSVERSLISDEPINENTL